RSSSTRVCPFAGAPYSPSWRVPGTLDRRDASTRHAERTLRRAAATDAAGEKRYRRRRPPATTNVIDGVRYLAMSVIVEPLAGLRRTSPWRHAHHTPPLDARRSVRSGVHSEATRPSRVRCCHVTVWRVPTSPRHVSVDRPGASDDAGHDD